jgi:hypothetical protein
MSWGVVGGGVGEPRDRHVRVADRLEPLAAEELHDPVEAGEDVVELGDQRPGSREIAIEVKPTQLSGSATATAVPIDCRACRSTSEPGLLLICPPR